MSMMRYMRGMSNGGAAYAQGAEPLTVDQLRQHVPSIFAETAHESRSERFVHIPTSQMLAPLAKEGFHPFFAQQAKTRDEGRRDFTKHMIRFRHASLKNDRDRALEIILINASNGASAFNLFTGIIEFLCANGLMTGEKFKEVHVRHTGDAITQVIEGAYTVLEEGPRVMDAADRFRSIELNHDERLAFAESAHMLRFEGQEHCPKPEDLLKVCRYGDRGGDLWKTFNVVQERLIRGGNTFYRPRFTETGAPLRPAHATSRPVNGIDGQKAINRALWSLTEKMADLKRAA